VKSIALPLAVLVVILLTWAVFAGPPGESGALAEAGPSAPSSPRMAPLPGLGETDQPRTSAPSGGAGGRPPQELSRAQALNDQAATALSEGRSAEAVLLLESAHGLAPDDLVLTKNLAFAHYRVAEGLVAAHDMEAAGAAFRRAWALDGSQSAYGLHGASLSLRAFSLDAALAQLDEVLASHPESGSGQLMRGDVLNLLDRLDEALVAYDLAALHGDATVAAAAATGRSRSERQLAVERDYVSEETEYFVVRHPPASDHLQLVGVLERARVEVCHALGDFPSHKALVVLYPPDAFRAVTGTHDWVGGLFDRKIRLPIADLATSAAQVESAFRHEFTHLMVSEWNPRCPTFVNEGLAQVMEYGRGQGLDRLVSYLDSRGLTRESLPALDELPDSFMSMADREAVSLGYLLSFAFVDHVVGHHGMGALVRWIVALEHAPLGAAYHGATGRTLEHEEELFRELVRTAR